MMYRLRGLALASLVIGGLSFAFAPSFADEGTGSSSGTTGSNTGATGDRAANWNQADQKAISQSVGKCVEAALNPNGWDQLVQCFSRADQQRLQQAQGQKPNEQFTSALQNFDKNWREHYKGEFRVANADTVFGPEFIRPGTSSEARPAGGRLEGEKPRSDTGNTGSSKTGNTGSTSGNTGNTGSSSADKTGGTSGSDATTAGHQMGNVQMVTIPSPVKDKQDLTVGFIKEGNDWKISLPSNIDQKQLQERLAHHIGQLNHDKQFWPQDQQQAQRLVAYHVFAALSGLGHDMKDMDKGSGTGGAGNTGGTGGTNR